jgi:uncharacterized membrane protein YcgQ (UPF0703/DUF1980 family)
MAHDHDPKTYYVEQLCTIAICGALGGIAVWLFATGALWFIAPKIQYWVLAGGIALLVLVAIRALVVWIQAGRIPADAHDHHHAHDHEHDHHHEHSAGHDAACAHDHDHDHSHGHSHNGPVVIVVDHGHEHGWAPWRYVILLLPVVLFCLGLPNLDMKQAGANELDKNLTNNISDAVASDTSDFLGEVDFRQLAAAPYTKQSRALYEGKTAILRGEYLPIASNDRMFTVVRFKMNCCSADRVPLPAVIILDRNSTEKIPHGLEGKWVAVRGQIQFQQSPDMPDVWKTVVVLRPDAEHPLIDPEGKNDKALIKVVNRPSDYYLY